MYSDCLQILNLGRVARQIPPFFFRTTFFSWRKIFFKKVAFSLKKLHFPKTINLYKVSFTNGHLKKKIKMFYLEDELEFFDHIAPSCSTHEYFKSSEYEALTPSHHGDTEIQYFHMVVQLKT